MRAYYTKHRELHSVLCGDLDGKESKKRMYVYVWLIHSLAVPQKLTQHCEETIV